MIDKNYLKRIFIQTFLSQEDEEEKPYYTSCAELPLSRFMWCLAKGDVWYLMKPKQPKVSKKILEPVWDDIFYEYMEISNDTNHKKVFVLMKEITSLNTRYVLIFEIVRQLTYKHHPLLVEQLHGLGFRKFAYDPSDYEKYRKELSLTLSLSTNLTIQSKKNSDELKELQKDTGGKSGEQGYEALLAEMSKFQGYRIDPEVVTVSEFVAITNRYKKHVELINRQQQNGKFGKN